MAKNILRSTFFLFAFGVMSTYVTQAQYYSTLYPLNQNKGGQIRMLTIVNDTIYTMCYGGDTAFPGTINVFARFDKTGSQIDLHPFFLRDSDLLTTSYQLIHTNDGGFACAGELSYNVDTGIGNHGQILGITKYRLAILKYDKGGELTWYKITADTNYSIFHCYSLVQDMYSNFYFTGNFNTTSNVNGGYLIKTDSLGNLIFEKHYTHPALPQCVTINTKGNIVLAGQGPKLEMTETDTAGMQIRSVLGNDSINFQPYSILKTDEGGYIIGGSQSCGTYSTKGIILNLDSDFHEQWHIDAGNCNYITSIYAQQKTADGNYIAAGTLQGQSLSNTNLYGWVMKYNSSGIVVWSKIYLPPSIQGNNGQCIFFSLGLLSDGSIICGGDGANFSATSPPADQAWLVHLDTTGCISSNDCGILTDVSEISLANQLISVYPDPASDQIRFKYPTDQASDWTIDLFNVLGQKINQTFDIRDHSVLDIDTSQWPSGIYFYHAKSQKLEIVSGTFVIRH